jgi:hypothetical protein
LFVCLFVILNERRRNGILRRPGLSVWNNIKMNAERMSWQEEQTSEHSDKPRTEVLMERIDSQ